MTTLTVTDPTVIVAAEGERFALRRKGETTQRLRAQRIDSIFLIGQVAITPAALSMALERGIDVVLLSKAGRYRGRLLGPTSRTGTQRAAQAGFVVDDTRALEVARAIVLGKVRNQRNVLLRAQQYRKAPRLAEALLRLRSIQRRIDSADATARLMGYEGDAAAIYFGAFGQTILNPDFSFTKRTRRPPRDPVNSCLSFGYVLLLSRLESAIHRAGLDVALGVLHQPAVARPALALDLLEEFRAPVVDTVVLRLVNRRQLRPTDFENPRDDLTEELLAGGEPPEPSEDGEAGPAVHLNETGRRILLRALGKRLGERAVDPTSGDRRTFRDLLLLQCYQMSRVFTGEAEKYRPVVVR